MASYGAGKFGRAGQGDAIAIEGFAQLQAALRRIEEGAHPELRARIKIIGEHVKVVARGNVPHKTGRHGPGPTIESSLKVGVTQSAASVYTTAPQGGAINVGAVVQGRGPHITRANASHYMDRAVTSSQAFVEQEVRALESWLLTTFQEG